MKRIGLLFLWLVCVCGVAHAQSAMHVVLLGDSNTWIGGDDCDKPEGWNKWFKDLAQPLSIKSYARSGATWTHTPKTVNDTAEYTEVLSDNNVIYNQVNRLKDAYTAGQQSTPDLIIIMAGTNDIWFANRRPDSLTKWIAYDCQLLQGTFPEAKIVLVTPPSFVKAGMKQQRKAQNAIKCCAKELNCGFVCTARVFDVKDMIAKGYSKDGVHTTSEGAKVLGTYIYEQIKAIVQQ